METQVVAIVLAAGLSSRMGKKNKLTTKWRDKPLINHCIEAAQSSRLRDIIVVTGHEAEAVKGHLPSNMGTVHNPAYASGMASSLITGVKAVLRQHIPSDGVLILLGDMPLVTADHINAMLDKFAQANRSPIIQATSDGSAGNPVLFPRRCFDELLLVAGDQGAKQVIRQDKEPIVLCEIGEAADRDFDDPAAFKRAQNGMQH